jgi:hypothetical protein
MVRLLRSRWVVGLSAFAVGLSIAGGLAWATIPNSTSAQIHACYTKTAATKTLRVIDYQSGQRCTSSEATISWQTKGMRWRGPYSNTVSYSASDVVSSAGSSYIATKATTGHTPPNATYWALMAARGPAGPAGEDGSQGPAGTVASLDAIDGLPCSPGTGWVGAAELSYEPDGTALIRCRFTSLSASFDDVTPPALPTAWTTDGNVPWVTAEPGADGTALSAHVDEAAVATDQALMGPRFTSPPTGTGELTFRHSFSTERDGGGIWDGAVLEVSLDAGASWVDISAVSTFQTGGYTGTVHEFSGSPLENRQAWGGSSGGYITTTVQLGSSLADQTLQFRWRFATDSSTGGSGWNVDSIQVTWEEPT